ncbi:MAG: single-stranded DNA-binding protein [Candidatus Gracilibacteria bacterium]|jgi:single-strand DNA-binding protein
MRSVNKVFLIGNLTRDPEMRQTPNGQNVTTFGVATNREWMTKNGEKKSSTEFHECVAWAKLAEIASKFLKKGNLVNVEGYLKTRNWDTPEGVRKFKTEIVVQDLIILEKRAKELPDVLPEEAVESGYEEAVPEEASAETEEEPKEKPAPKKSKENPIDKDLGL